MNSSHHTEFLTWDDTAIISKNPVVNQGLSPDSAVEPLTSETLNLWHPFTLWSHQLDVTLFGLNPDLHHLSAIVYHLLAGLALFFALIQFKTPPSFNPEENHRPLVSKNIGLITTLLFLLHPMHVESWAWLSERKDTLSAIFAFLSLAFWARFIAKHKSKPKLNYSLSLIFLTCGLMSKPSLIIWPAILLLTAQWQAPQLKIKAHLPTVGKLIPHLIICALVAGITYSFQLNRGEDILKVIATRSPFENLLVGFNNIWIYFTKIFYPHPLSYFYQPLQIYPKIGSTLGISLFGFCTYFSWKLRKSFPLLFWVWGIFFITLAPVCGFIMSGESNAPDRYSYLAYTGPFLLISILTCRGLQHLKHTFPKIRILAVALATTALTALSVLSVKRSLDWKNMESLTTAAIRSHPQNHIPHHHLALLHIDRNQPEKARFHIERSLKLFEGNRLLWTKLAMMELEADNTDLATKHFKKQLVHSPNDLTAHTGLAKIYLEQNNYGAALPHLQKAVRLAPENTSYRTALQQCSEAIQ